MNFILDAELNEKYHNSKQCTHLVSTPAFRVFSKYDSDADCTITKEEYVKRKNQLNEGNKKLVAIMN